MTQEITFGAGLPAFPPEFLETYGQCRSEFDARGVFFLEDAYLRSNREFYPRIEGDLLQEAARLRQDVHMARYALFVFRAMAHRELFLRYLSLFRFPREYPLFAFLCLIPAMPAGKACLLETGIPEDIVAQTMGQYEACVFLHRERFDCLGLDKRYFDHLQLYVDCKVLNIGRLRFERMTLQDPVYFLRHRQTGERVLLFGEGVMNREGLYADTPPVRREARFRTSLLETEDAWLATPVSPEGRCCRETRRFPKAEYCLLARPGDNCLSVHIPGEAPLTQQHCRDSYRRAVEVFARCYPQWQWKAFHCHSWLLSPELRKMLKPDSGILRFQSQYLLYPVPTRGEDVLNFVFKLRFTGYHDLPEDTSLQRQLKKRYLSGEKLYEYGGLFPREDIL